MDDLNGLDWSASSSSTKPIGAANANYYPSLRPTPSPQNSGRSTPLSAQGSGAFKPAPKPFVAPKPGTPDSFSNLVSFGSSKQQKLTLQEQQAKLQAEKLNREAEKRKQYEAQYGNNQFWDGIGNRGSPAFTPPATSRSTTPALKPVAANISRTISPPTASGSAATGNGADDDLFAAFNADTKVDNSSFYPPPSIPSSGRTTPAKASTLPDLSQAKAWEPSSSSLRDFPDDDDDPFDLGQMQSRTTPSAPTPGIQDDDDFLGDLGKPVEEVRRPSPALPAAKPRQESEPESDDPWDKAVAELVDMGFTTEQSRQALTESGSGLDIHAAVGWILNDAHRQAKEKQQGRTPAGSNGSAPTSQRSQKLQDRQRREESPAWRQQDRDLPRPRRDDSSPNGEADLSRTAAATASSILKTANSFWKTSQKKVQKAVAEFQQESDSSQPRWMREAAEREAEEKRGAARRSQATEVTDEALMLEGGGRPQPRKMKAPEQRFPSSNSNSSRDQSPSMPNPPGQKLSQVPRWQQSAPQDSRSRLTKEAVEEQSAQAYVSPARRKKATPQPQPPQPISDTSFSASAEPISISRPTARPSPAPSKPSTPIPTRPKAPPRQIPHLSTIALQSSNQHRLTGTAHFKRGDYASAHSSYTASLSALPNSHPITIILLCNRALTSLKTGIPKEAVTDADSALKLIGVARGDGETIDLGPGEGGGSKEMKEFYGKALMRKAEALEQMERWSDALQVWKLCVESGVGGGPAIQGRGRCEKALAPKPALSRASAPKAVPRPKPKSAIADLGNGKDSAAVKRLREANEKAGKEDDEKFALSDQVESRIGAWRDGKRDNLRALIGSLDNVMWEGSGWKKVGMHELIQNNKVKINYMKAIGKCHPDKLPQDATTEVRMIAALVFATLNESWDKFKEQNGL